MVFAVGQREARDGLAVRILNLDAGFGNRTARKNIVGQFMKAAEANVEAGAEVIIPAGGVVMARGRQE